MRGVLVSSSSELDILFLNMLEDWGIFLTIRPDTITLCFTSTSALFGLNGLKSLEFLRADRHPFKPPATHLSLLLRLQ